MYEFIVVYTVVQYM